MAASQEPVYVYPDPSMFGLNGLPRLQDSPSNIPIASNQPSIPVLTDPGPPFAIDPALLQNDRQAAAHAAGVATSTMVPATASTSIPSPAPPAVPVPALIVGGPAPAQAPIPGPVPTMRPSARGLRPFPELIPGLQAPIELTNARDTTHWNNRLNVSLSTDHMGLRTRRDGTRKRDKLDKSQRDRQSRARQDLKVLWEKAGGTPYVPGKAYNH